MPEDSALSVSLQGGPQFRGWTVQTYLLARLLDTARFADANNVKVNGGKLKGKPKPVEVPTVKSETPKRRLDLSNHPLAQPISMNTKG